MVRAGDELWRSNQTFGGEYETLVRFRYAINDLRPADEPEEEELAEDSPRLARYVAMSRSDMVEFLTDYASYLIEDYAKRR